MGHHLLVERTVRVGFRDKAGPEAVRRQPLPLGHGEAGERGAAGSSTPRCRSAGCAACPARKGRGTPRLAPDRFLRSPKIPPQRARPGRHTGRRLNGRGRRREPEAAVRTKCWFRRPVGIAPRAVTSPPPPGHAAGAPRPVPALPRPGAPRLRRNLRWSTRRYRSRPRRFLRPRCHGPWCEQSFPDRRGGGHEVCSVSTMIGGATMSC